MNYGGGACGRACVVGTAWRNVKRIMKKERSCHKFISIIKIILSRVSQPGEDEVMNTKLLYITHNALELFSKATQRTAQFDMGGE